MGGSTPGQRASAFNEVMTYRDAAPAYLEAGWQSPLPLPRRRKEPVPSGFTGHAGEVPTCEQLERWRVEFPDGNLALRLPDGWVGIDVDAYKPEGAASFDELVEECGAFPPTW